MVEDSFNKCGKQLIGRVWRIVNDNQLRASRRTFLASWVGATTIGLAGCTKDRTDSDRTYSNPAVGCEEETHPGLEFDTKLLSTAYDEQSEIWKVTCSVVGRFDYVSEHQSDVGFTDAALSAYSVDGTRIARRSLGDVTWEDVPSSNRVSFDAECGGGRYETGRLVRQEQLEMPRFPYWFGLNCKDRTGLNPVEDGDGVVKYTGDAESDVTPQVAEYKQVTVERNEWPPSNRNE